MHVYMLAVAIIGGVCTPFKQFGVVQRLNKAQTRERMWRKPELDLKNESAMCGTSVSEREHMVLCKLFWIGVFFCGCEEARKFNILFWMNGWNGHYYNR